jgi:hypothetical protein
MLKIRLPRLAALCAALASLVSCSAAPDDPTDTGNGAATAAAGPTGPKTVKLELCDKRLQVINLDAPGAIRFTTTIPAGQAAGLNIVGSDAGVKAAKGDPSRGADNIDDETHRTTVNLKSADGEWNGSGKSQYVIPAGSSDAQVTVTVTFASQYGGAVQAAEECTPTTCDAAKAEQREPLAAPGASRDERVKAILDACHPPPSEADVLFAASAGASFDSAALSAILAKYNTRVSICSPIGFPYSCRGDTCANVVLGKDVPLAWASDRCE